MSIVINYKGKLFAGVADTGEVLGDVCVDKMLQEIQEDYKQLQEEYAILEVS